MVIYRSSLTGEIRQLAFLSAVAFFWLLGYKPAHALLTADQINSLAQQCTGSQENQIIRILQSTAGHKDFSKKPQPEWIVKRLTRYEDQLADMGCKLNVSDMGKGNNSPILAQAAFTVGTTSQLVNAFKKAQCGDTIAVAEGRYNSAVTLDKKCSASKPLNIIGKNNSVIFSNRTTLKGANIRISQINFKGPRANIIVYGNNHKLIGNRFTGWVGSAVFLDKGRDTEIGYNEFYKPASWGHSLDSSYPLRIGVRSSHRADRFHSHAHIHHNHFYDFPKKPSSNYHSGQSDAIEVCATGTLLASHFTVEWNRIERHYGEHGVIDIKCSSATVQYNTLLNSPRGRIDLRYGKNSMLKENWIENAGGSAIRGGYHQITRNVYRSTTQGLVIAAGNASWNATSGKLSPAAHMVTLINNDTDRIIVGETYNRFTTPATRTVIDRFDNEKIIYEKSVETSVNNKSTSKNVKATKISIQDVGPRAINYFN